MSDSIEIVAVPSLRQRVEELAPRVRLEMTQIPTHRIPQALQAGEIDFAIGSYGPLGDDIVREHLFNDPFVLLVARSHALPRNPSREALQQTTLRGGWGVARCRTANGGPRPDQASQRAHASSLSVRARATARRRPGGGCRGAFAR